MKTETLNINKQELNSATYHQTYLFFLIQVDKTNDRPERFILLLIQ